MKKNSINYQLIDTFVHEIKTPLTTQKLFAELICSPANLEKIKTYAQKINNKVDEITTTVNYFRDIGKITDNSYEIKPQRITSSSLAKSIHGHMLANSFSQKLIYHQDTNTADYHLDTDVLNQICKIITDRFFYYQPDAKNYYLSIFNTSAGFQLLISNSLRKLPLPQKDFDNTPVQKLPNPNTALYFVQYLLQYLNYHWCFRRDKNSQLYAVYISKN